MALAQLVKSDPVYSLFGHTLIREGEDRVVASATVDELMTAVRLSGQEYAEETLEAVCTDMTYPGRFLDPVDGEEPSYTLILYLAVESIRTADMVRNCAELKKHAAKACAMLQKGQKFIGILDAGEKVASETEF